MQPSPDDIADGELAGSQAREPAAGARRATSDDPLAHALAWVTRHHGRGRSAQSLLAGLPTTERMDGALAVRALQEAGFQAGLVERRIGEMSALLLPAVLLLRAGDACIITARHPDGKTYDVVMPGEVTSALDRVRPLDLQVLRWNAAAAAKANKLMSQSAARMGLTFQPQPWPGRSKIPPGVAFHWPSTEQRIDPATEASGWSCEKSHRHNVARSLPQRPGRHALHLFAVPANPDGR
jgi:hypothetical protein